MDKWEVANKQAEEQVKEKILNDLEKYLIACEYIPTLNQYLSDREQYLQQIWENIWINKITSIFSLKEKKRFIMERNLADEGLDKKSIKKVFSQATRRMKSFDVVGWLNEELQDEQVWTELYNKTKIENRERLSKQETFEKRARAMETLKISIEELFQQKKEELYVYIRYYIAENLLSDIQTKTKYTLIGNHWQNERLVENGSFSIKDFIKVNDFFEEYTGDILQIEDWGRLYYDFEQFGDIYEQKVIDYITRGISILFPQEMQKLIETYLEITKEPITIVDLLVLFEDEIDIEKDDFMNWLAGEYIQDLVVFIETPFDLVGHMDLYHKQLAIAAQKQLEEEKERKRKKEEEKRLITDVFEREFQPAQGRGVKYILHIGETNTGKTYRALQKMKEAESGCYLAPLRLLALEVFDTLNSEGVPCSLKTGEEENMNPSANHIASTVEMFYEKDRYECIVIDEAQMIADKERGFAWYKAITKANADEVHIIGSRNSKEMILSLLEESDVEVIEYEREIPLKVETKVFKVDHAKKGDAIICFSRKKVLETAAYLQQKGRKVSMIYGSMPPETRKAQIARFNSGKTDVIVSTDAIGMGLNLPIKRIAFLENEKFDGTKRRRLTSQEVKQIAGRAGRKGIYNTGKVSFTQEINKMKSLLEKDDEPLSTFTIAPTSAMFERFQRYSRDLGKFFELWEKFKNPRGTIKAQLSQEKELYELVRGTEIEARLSMDELYGFLHLPFSSNDSSLTDQWLTNMKALVSGQELPEPVMKTDSLDEVELTYKAIGLHLLFLYRLEKRTEAVYWERLRKEISEEADLQLSKTVRKMKKSCKRCGRRLPMDFGFPICDQCFARRSSAWG